MHKRLINFSYIFIFAIIITTSLFGQNESIDFLNKSINFGYDESSVFKLFKGYEKVTQTNEPAEITLYSKTYINKDINGNELPFDVNFYFYSNKFFGAEFIEYYTAEGPDPNYKKYERINISLDNIVGQLSKVSERDSLGIKYIYLEKNNIKAIFYSEDYANLSCFDINVITEIRKSYQKYRHEFQ